MPDPESVARGLPLWSPKMATEEDLCPVRGPKGETTRGDHGLRIQDPVRRPQGETTRGDHKTTRGNHKGSRATELNNGFRIRTATHRP